MSTKSGLAIVIVIGLLLGSDWYLRSQRLSINPELTFTTITGQTINLRDLQGKPVLISFWATDCRSCIEEIPQLIGLHQQYAQTGLTIIAVAMYYDPPNRVLNMAADKQLPYAVALDPERTLAKAFGGVQMTPTTFLLDRAGRVDWKQLGRFDASALQQRVKTIVQ